MADGTDPFAILGLAVVWRRTRLASAAVSVSPDTASHSVRTKNASALSARSMPPASSGSSSSPLAPSAPSRIERSVFVTCLGRAARYGVIVHIDEAGVPVNFFTSGITPEERLQLVK